MLQAFRYTFRAGTLAGVTEPRQVLFYTQGQRATKGAAERIARAVSEYTARAVADGDVAFIKSHLIALESVWQSDLDKAHGLYSYRGRDSGGAVEHAVKC